MYYDEEGGDEHKDDICWLRRKRGKKDLDVVWRGGGARGKSANKQKELKSLNENAAGKQTVTATTKTATTTN